VSGGTYAEPGSRTFEAEHNRGQFVAKCRYCEHEIVLHSDASGAVWRHLDTGETRCSLTATPTEAVA
jgi:hypothetical protein